jgi:outer membrane lipoprotein-sorting protein
VLSLLLERPGEVVTRKELRDRPWPADTVINQRSVFVAIEERPQLPAVGTVAKGTKVELERIEKVENHDTYKLKLTLKSGQVQNVWVDAQTFLEVKIEGTPRRLDGKYHAVATYFRDYRSVDRLMLPYVLETAVDGVKQMEKIQIESIAVNPKVSDSRFAKIQ